MILRYSLTNSDRLIADDRDCDAEVRCEYDTIRPRRWNHHGFAAKINERPAGRGLQRDLVEHKLM